MMSKLDRIQIATPCPMTWEQMPGDEHVRFCNHCQLNVYNLSSLSQAQAEALLVSTEGRLCARLYRRSDGTVMTRDCPVGIQAIRRKMVRTAAAVFALVGSLTSIVSGQTKNKKDACTVQTRITNQEIISNSGETILTGQILDPSGSVVPGATMILQNVKTKKTEKTISTPDGRFQFVGMTPGKYLIKIESPGFSKVLINDLEISQKQAIGLDVILSPDYGEVMIGIIGETPNDPPGTTTISEKLLRSLPH